MKIIQCYVDRMLLSVSIKQLFPAIVNLYFKPSVTACSCGNNLKIYKTQTRGIATLSFGESNACIAQLHCESCKKIYYPEELKLIVPKNSHFSFDIIVYVGTELFVHHRNDDEIQKLLQEKNISISLRVAHPKKKLGKYQKRRVKI
jgi:hypothetical protein